VYISLLKLDPLYFYTDATVDNLVYTLLERSWYPLLLHMQEEYSPPIGLDGLFTPVRKLVSSDDLTLPARNFKYHVPTPKNIFQSTAYEALKRVYHCRDTNLRSGVVCKVTVTLPLSPHDEYWHRRSLRRVNYPETQEHYTWESSSTTPTLSFQVTKWAPDPATAKLYVTDRANDIIQYIRHRLHHSPPLTYSRPDPSLIPPPSPVCPALQLGRLLTDQWKSNPTWFTTTPPRVLVLQLLNAQILLPQNLALVPLLSYYKVSPAPHPPS
jgi:hypothetical protein